MTIHPRAMLAPTRFDWRVELVFRDGSRRVVRVYPSSLEEPQAILEAKRHAKIIDESVLDEVRAARVEAETRVARFGAIQK